MANTVVSLFSIVMLLCIAAAQERNNLQSNIERLKSSSVLDNVDDGICKTMVETQGYTCEEHKVTTEDGYILSLQRLPAGRFGEKAQNPPVLLQHGLNLDAVTWLANSPEESLGFILADSGYDVWLANFRGTQSSRGHTSLNSTDAEYWDWSWDELANYDLPAFVQYVYNYTGQKIHYAGHSLGTLMALTSLSEGHLLDMLRSAALLCPVAHLNQLSSLIVKFAAETFAADFLYWLGVRFIPDGEAASKLLRDICHILPLECSNLLTPSITGPNCCMNLTAFKIVLDHGLQPTSTKNLIHLSQMVKTGNIGKFDYCDPVQNVQHYGQTVPPLYDMSRISNEFPLFVSYGGLDFLSDENDVLVLLNDDLNDHDLTVLFMEEYAHLDFIMGVNAKQLVYDPMIAFFEVN